jgi:hypothetical protein
VLIPCKNSHYYGDYASCRPAKKGQLAQLLDHGCTVGGAGAGVTFYVKKWLKRTSRGGYVLAACGIYEGLRLVFK